MSHIEVTDEWLYKYIPIVDAAMIRALESEVDTSYEFSEEYERKMKKVIEMEAKMWVQDFFRFVRKAAVVVICILGALFALTMSVEAYRNKFFQTVKEIWEDSVIYTYFSEVSEEGFREMEPQYIPEGYSEVSRVYMEKMLSITYQNNCGDYIILDQMLAIDGRYNILDANYERQEEKEINGKIVTISTYSDGYVAAWYEEGDYIYILNANNINVVDLYYIFENIK